MHILSYLNVKLEIFVLQFWLYFQFHYKTLRQILKYFKLSVKDKFPVNYSVHIYRDSYNIVKGVSYIFKNLILL